MGDILADRGNNDYLTLKLLEKLHSLEIPYEIMLSNHDLWFIEAAEDYFQNPSKVRFDEINSVALLTDAPWLITTGRQGQSLVNFSHMINNAVLSRASFEALYNIYKSWKKTERD